MHGNSEHPVRCLHGLQWEQLRFNGVRHFQQCRLLRLHGLRYRPVRLYGLLSHYQRCVLSLQFQLPGLYRFGFRSLHDLQYRLLQGCE
jgi:hypothetical protein